MKHRTFGSVRFGATAVAALLIVSGAAFAKANRYFTAPFSVQTNSVVFGQDPSWTHGLRSRGSASPLHSVTMNGSVGCQATEWSFAPRRMLR